MRPKRLESPWLVLVISLLFAEMIGPAGAWAASARTGLAGGHPALVDALGDTLPAGPYPQRLISLSPSLTEMLFALGVAPERIVGVTRYCDYPPEAAGRPGVGGIVDPSLEQILARDPDVVLVTRGNPLPVIERMRALGLTVFALDDRGGIEEVGRLMEQVLDLAGSDSPEEARRLMERFDHGIRLYKDWSDTLDPQRRPVVYYADPENPDWTAGPGSHIEDLIRLAGGVNLVQEGGSWPRYSAEMLVLRQPDLLLLARPEGKDSRELLRFMRGRPGWKDLEAVKQGRICWIDSGLLLRPGPRSLLALDRLAGCLHPDIHPGREGR